MSLKNRNYSGETISTIHNQPCCLPYTIKTINTICAYKDTRDIILCKNMLHHPFITFTCIIYTSNKKQRVLGMTRFLSFRGNQGIVQKNIFPNRLHQIPVLNTPVFDGVLDVVVVGQEIGLFADHIRLFLEHHVSNRH